MKKLTRKQAEEILERQYGDIETGKYIRPFCWSMRIELNKKFRNYWYDINISGYRYIDDYFEDYFYDNTEISLLRLLTAHIFIRENYK